jgi:hypothetical protein
MTATIGTRTLSAATPPANDLRGIASLIRARIVENSHRTGTPHLGADMRNKRVTLLSGDIGNKRTQLKKATAAFAALQTGEGAWRM